MNKKNVFIIGFIVGLLSGGVAMLYRCGFRLDRALLEVEKNAGYFALFDKWMTLKEKGISLGYYFQANGIKKVAICGMGKAGKHLKSELEKTAVTVPYVIDEGEFAFYQYDTVFSASDFLPEVDLIVVTPFYDFDEIQKKIHRKNPLNVVSLKTIIDSMASQYKNDD